MYAPKSVSFLIAAPCNGSVSLSNVCSPECIWCGSQHNRDDEMTIFFFGWEGDETAVPNNQHGCSRSSVTDPRKSCF